MGVSWGGGNVFRIGSAIHSRARRNHPSSPYFAPKSIPSDDTSNDHNDPTNDYDRCPSCKHDVYHDIDDGCSYHYFTPGTPDNHTRCACKWKP